MTFPPSPFASNHGSHFTEKTDGSDCLPPGKRKPTQLLTSRIFPSALGGGSSPPMRPPWGPRFFRTLLPPFPTKLVLAPGLFPQHEGWGASSPYPSDQLVLGHPPPPLHSVESFLTELASCLYPATPSSLLCASCSFRFPFVNMVLICIQVKRAHS